MAQSDLTIENDNEQDNGLSNGPTEEGEEVDDEGLLRKGYDIILCGTGLTQSILAAALTRAGKSVMHCDGNEFYGDLDAVHSLASLKEWSINVTNRQPVDRNREEPAVTGDSFIPLDSSECYSSLTIDSESAITRDAICLKKGMKVETPYGMGTLLDTPSAQDHTIESLPVQLDDWILADGKHAVLYVGKKEVENSWNVTPYDVVIYKEYVEKKQRAFALDLSPGLILANGEAVEGIINSGVNEYCEFKSLQGVYLLMHDKQKTTSVVETKSLEDIPILTKVPCSKRDVFQTKLLSPMDKRRIMKFLQLAADYAVTLSLPSNLESDTNDEGVKNMEKEGDKKPPLQEDIVMSLNERQLQQGRSLSRPQNKTVATYDMETLQKSILEEMTFEKYLKEHHKFSDDMVKIIIHAMAMGSRTQNQSEYSTKDGMHDLCKHLLSLGKFGSTAFLVPLYGSGELSQAFCRSAAVHGGTYLLRRGPQSIQMDENGAVCGIMLDCRSDDNSPTQSVKFIRAKHVVVPLPMMPQPSSSTKRRRRLYRRISILRGQIVTNSDQQDSNRVEQRHIIIIPPGDHFVQNESVVHGLVLDDSVNITPRAVNDLEITILHLTTVGNAPAESAAASTHVLSNAVQALCANNHCVELYHLDFSYDIREEEETWDTPGLHVCRPSRDMTCTIDSSFVEAKRLFEKICPNESFLLLSKDMDEILRERHMGINDDNTDDEVQVLESAMSMMKALDPL